MGAAQRSREPERSNSCATPGDFHAKQGLAIFSGAGAAQVRRNRELVNGAVCNFLRSAGRIWRRRILIRRHRGQAALSTGLSTAAGQQAAQRKTWSRKRKHAATTGPAGCLVGGYRALLESQDALGQLGGLFVGYRIRRHGNRARYTTGAILDVTGQQLGGTLLIGVLGRDFLQCRTDQFGVDGVTGNAGLALEQGFVSSGSVSCSQRCDGNQRQQVEFHGVSSKG